MTRGELRGLIQTSLRELREGGEDGMSSSPRASTAQVQAAISTAREVWHSFSECIWLPRADWSFALWFPPSLAEESCSERLQVPCALLRDRPAVPWPVFFFRCTRVAQCFEYPPKRRGCSLMLTSPSRGLFLPVFHRAVRDVPPCVGCGDCGQGMLRTVDAHLARARSAHHEELLTQVLSLEVALRRYTWPC